VFPLMSLLASGRRVALGMAAVALVAVAAIAPSAHAVGTYIHQSCGGIGDANVGDSYGGWAQFNSGAYGGGTTNENQCNWGGLHTNMTPTGSNVVPLGGTLGWRYTAPANTYIAGARFQLGGWVDAYDNVNRGVLSADANPSGRIGFFTSDSNGALWPNPLTVNQGGLHDTSLSVSLSCDGPTGHAGCGSPWQTGWMAIFGPVMFLGDDNAPTAGATSGTMASATQLKGTQTLTYSATDAGGGITRFRLYVDGNVVQEYGLFPGTNCDPVSSEGGSWMFKVSKPCPNSVTTTASYDTTVLADGSHSISARVVDVSGREATLYSATKVAVNHPPVNTAAPTWEDAITANAPKIGDTLTAKPGTWTGPSLTYTTAWEECDANGANCAVIPDKTGVKYVLTAADAGHRVRYVQTASNVAGSVNASSPLSALLPVPPTNGGGGDGGGDGGNGGDGSGGDGAGGGGSGSNPAVVVNVGSGAAGANGVNGLGRSGSSAAHVFLGQIAGQAAGVPCPKDTAKLTLQKIKSGAMKLGSGRTASVRVLLTCAETGKAIIGAHLDVTTKISGRPTASQIVTGGTGLATLKLAKGPSRGITIGYRMYADDPIARATTTLKVSVPAKISLKARPKALRNGRPVLLSGTLVGGHVPKRGVALAVQWKDGKRWRTFGQIRAKGSKGAFHYRYRFTRTNYSVRYRLRVTMIKGQVDYPFVATSSKSISVVVRP
jgi:hypothetical protein